MKFDAPTMASMHLSEDELVELTHYKLAKKQAQALALMGFIFKLRPDGSVAVLRAHVEKEMGVSESIPHMQAKKGVNLEWMDA